MPGLTQTTVADAIHPGILACEADATLRNVARMMATNRVHCIAVMGIQHEDGSERLVWGVSSDLDGVRAGVFAPP